MTPVSSRHMVPTRIIPNGLVHTHTPPRSIHDSQTPSKYTTFVPHKPPVLLHIWPEKRLLRNWDLMGMLGRYLPPN